MCSIVADDRFHLCRSLKEILLIGLDFLHAMYISLTNSL